MGSIGPASAPAPTFVTGHASAGGDLDVFSVELQQGQRYVIELELRGSGGESIDEAQNFAWVRISSLEPQGWRFSGRLPTDAGAQTVDVVAWRDGVHLIEVASQRGQSGEFDYALRVLPGGEDRPAQRPQPAPLDLTADAPLAINLPPGWSPDLVQLRVEAGQSVLLTVERSDAAAVSAPSEPPPWLYLQPRHADGSWSSWMLFEPGRDQFIFSSDQGDLITLGISNHGDWRGGDDPGVPLTLRLEPAPADDHANLRAGATPLAIGESASFHNELRGDIDWFRIDVRAGERIVALVENQTGTAPIERSSLTIVDGTDPDAASWWRPGSSPSHWWAQHDGPLFVGVQRGEYYDGLPRVEGLLQTLTVQRGSGDGWAQVETAGLSGEGVLRGELSAWKLFERHTLWLEGGQRYLLHKQGEGSVWVVNSELPSSDYWSSWQPNLDGQREAHTGAWIVAPAESGWFSLWVSQYEWSSFNERSSYEVTIEPLPADDHGDTLAQATVLAEWQTALARLDPSDTDVFALDLVAGQRYALHVLTDRIPLDAAVAMIDPEGVWLDSWWLCLGLGTDHSEQLFEPTSSGRHLLRLQADGVLATVSYNRIAGDDHGDSWFSATPIRVSAIDPPEASIARDSGVFLMGLSGLNAPESEPLGGP